MNIIDENIDGGQPFDWGRTSADYAKFRDIYPEEFYQKILDRNLCTACQCFWYFDHETLMPKLWHMLKQEGSMSRNRRLFVRKRYFAVGERTQKTSVADCAG